MKLEVFNNEVFGSVRTIAEGEVLLFAATDVARALGYTNPHKAIRDHVDIEDRTERSPLTEGGVQKMVFINEPGIYSLVFNSKLPSAKKFKRWVFEEVLPSLRKHGGYIIGQETYTLEQFQEAADKYKSKVEAEFKEKLLLQSIQNEKLILKLKAEHNNEKNLIIEAGRRKVKQLKEEREVLLTNLKDNEVRLNLAKLQQKELEGLVEANRMVGEADGTISIKALADILSIEGLGRNNLFTLLRHLGILCKSQASKNLPYRQYIEAGYFKPHTNSDYLNHTTKVTGKGVEWLALKIKSWIETTGWKKGQALPEA